MKNQKVMRTNNEIISMEWIMLGREQVETGDGEEDVRIPDNLMITILGSS